MRFVATIGVGLLLCVGSIGRAQPTAPGAPRTVELSRDVRLGLESTATLSTQRVDVLGGDLSSAELVAALIEEAVAVLPARLQRPELRLTVRINPVGEGPCPVRAFAGYWNGSAGLIINLDPAWRVSELRRIVAHEVGHVYHFAARQGAEGPAGDGLLSEGLATWLAAPFWLADLGFESFAELVAFNRERGVYFPFVDDHELDLATLAGSPAECLALRDALYSQRAAFVGFLIERYGLEAVLMATEQPVDLLEVGPDRWEAPRLDYEAAFGLPLAELERAWLEALSREASP